MIIGFHKTSNYLPPHGPKDTTRRRWAQRTIEIWQRAWDNGRLTHVATDKSLRNGGQRIGEITLKARPFLQRLRDMPESDLRREGGMCATVDEFIEAYFQGDRDAVVCVVRFDFQPYSIQIA